MSEYHKIQTLYKRDLSTKYKTLLEGRWTMPEFEYLAREEWTWTEKIDGMNIRVIINGDDVQFKGRTDNAQLPMQLVDRLKELFAEVPAFFDKGAVLYGEGYGAKIQKSGAKYRPNQDFILFDVNIGGKWLQRRNVVQIAKDLNIATVPVVGRGDLYAAETFVQRGFNSVFGDFLAEGLVMRPSVELLTSTGERIITKLKHKDFTHVSQ